MNIQWYWNIPPVTRFIFTVSVALGAGVTTGFFKNESIFAFVPQKVLEGEVWRPLTSLFFAGGLDIQAISYLPWLLEMSRSLEQAHFSSGTHYAWALVVVSAVILAVSPFIKILYGSKVIFAMLPYLYGRYHPELRVFLLFITLPLSYVNLTLMMWNFLSHRSVVPDLLGIFLGHVLFFSNTVIPMLTGKSPLEPPFRRVPQVA